MKVHYSSSQIKWPAKYFLLACLLYALWIPYCQSSAQHSPGGQGGGSTVIGQSNAKDPFGEEVFKKLFPGDDSIDCDELLQSGKKDLEQSASDTDKSKPADQTKDQQPGGPNQGGAGDQGAGQNKGGRGGSGDSGSGGAGGGAPKTDNSVTLKPAQKLNAQNKPGSAFKYDEKGRPIYPHKPNGGGGNGNEGSGNRGPGTGGPGTGGPGTGGPGTGGNGDGGYENQPVRITPKDLAEQVEAIKNTFPHVQNVSLPAIVAQIPHILEDPDLTNEQKHEILNAIRSILADADNLVDMLDYLTKYSFPDASSDPSEKGAPASITKLQDLVDPEKSKQRPPASRGRDQDSKPPESRRLGFDSDGEDERYEDSSPLSQPPSARRGGDGEDAEEPLDSALQRGFAGDGTPHTYDLEKEPEGPPPPGWRPEVYPEVPGSGGGGGHQPQIYPPAPGPTSPYEPPKYPNESNLEKNYCPTGFRQFSSPNCKKKWYLADPKGECWGFWYDKESNSAYAGQFKNGKENGRGIKFEQLSKDPNAPRYRSLRTEHDNGTMTTHQETPNIGYYRYPKPCKYLDGLVKHMICGFDPSTYSPPYPLMDPLLAERKSAPFALAS